MRFLGRIMRAGKILREAVVTDDGPDTRTHKVFGALGEVCRTCDLSVPVWLDNNIKDFQKYRKTRFNQDNFVGEEIPFDHLEFQVLDED